MRLADAYAGRSRRLLACRTCGIRVSSDAWSPRCAFCAGTDLADLAPWPAIHEPLTVLPFTIMHAEAAEKVRAWVRVRWWLPRAVQNQWPAVATPVFVPLWRTRARSVTRWRGRRGRQWTTRETYFVGPGPTATREQVHVGWSSVSGTLTWDFEGLLDHALQGPITGRLERLAPWGAQVEAPSGPQTITQCQVLLPEVDRDQAWQRSRARAITTIRRECFRRIGGDQQILDEVRPTWPERTQQLLLVPIWVFTFDTGKRAMQVLVHARTGRMAWGARRTQVAYEFVFALIGIVLVSVPGIVLIQHLKGPG